LLPWCAGTFALSMGAAQERNDEDKGRSARGVETVCSHAERHQQALFDPDPALHPKTSKLARPRPSAGSLTACSRRKCPWQACCDPGHGRPGQTTSSLRRVLFGCAGCSAVRAVGFGSLSSNNCWIAKATTSASDMCRVWTRSVSCWRDSGD
jgi:hypothetical protein